MKVLTIVGTRPEVIKLSRVIAELDTHLEHVLVHTGQNFDFELNEIFFRELGLRPPNHVLDAVGDTLAETIARIISATDRVLELERPDAVLILGDTNSALSVIPAKRRKIPIFHMEAGNRSFDQRVPEEINRRIVDHTADVNLPYTEHARRYLLREGLRPDLIIKTGSPMHEVLEHYRAGIEASPILGTLGVMPRSYFVVSSHREENVDDPTRLALLVEVIDAVAVRYAAPVIVSTHPRTRARLEQSGTALDRSGLVRFVKPLGFLDYVKLQTTARCVLSDSGTITEESSILSFPAVTLRGAHERPEGMDEGTLVMCDLHPARVLEAVNVVMRQAEPGAQGFRMVADYEARNVSGKVVRIILSYTDYVNRTVWFKHT